jgi:hypothetical protein
MKRAVLLLGLAILPIGSAAAQGPRCEVLLCMDGCTPVRTGNTCTCKCSRPLTLFEGMRIEAQRLATRNFDPKPPDRPFDPLHRPDKPKPEPGPPGPRPDRPEPGGTDNKPRPVPF